MRFNSGVAIDPRERATRASPKTPGVGTGEIMTSKEPRNSKPPAGVIAGSGPGGSQPAYGPSAPVDNMGNRVAHGTVDEVRSPEPSCMLANSPEQDSKREAPTTPSSEEALHADVAVRTPRVSKTETACRTIIERAE